MRCWPSAAVALTPGWRFDGAGIDAAAARPETLSIAEFGAWPTRVSDALADLCRQQELCYSFDR